MGKIEKTLNIVLVLCVALILAAGVYVVDKLISRPDRIAFERRVADLVSVRDAAMRYEYRTGSLPESLDNLVHAYLRKNQLYAQDKALYTYDRNGSLIQKYDTTHVDESTVFWSVLSSSHQLPAEPSQLVASVS